MASGFGTRIVVWASLLGSGLLPPYALASAIDCPLHLRTAEARAEAYSEKGHLQAAAWLFAESGFPDRADVLFRRMESDLKTGKIRSIRKRPRGVNRTESFDVLFEDGRKALFKLDRSHGNSAGAEIAAYLLDRLYGTNLFPVVAYREIDGMKGSIHYLVEGATDATNATDHDIAFLDYLMNNPDRRPFRNHMVMSDEPGRIFGIDHGLAFGTVDQPAPGRSLTSLRPSSDLIRTVRETSDERVREALRGTISQEAIEAFLRRKSTYFEVRR